MGRLPLSIIVPLAPGETQWPDLLACLDCLLPEDEIIFTTPEPFDAPVRIIESNAGRAASMNMAARVANHSHLWFLHADSRFDPVLPELIRRAFASSQDIIIYSDLAFQSDGPVLMSINAFGTRMRSNWFGMPFGDQGLALGKKAFEALGGYDETLAYGEDHLLVWRARQNGMRLVKSGGTITTSARKYVKRGWTRTTVEHLWLTFKQAAPEAWKLLRGKRA